MILFYSSQLTARLSYILEVFLRKIAGYDYRYTGQWQEYLEFEGPKINYSDNYDETGLFIQSAGLLFSQGIDTAEPQTRQGINGTVVFPVTDERACMDFDPFAAAFYLLSLYDEYLQHPVDQHGRIVPESTFVFRNGFLDHPVVEEWALMLSEEIRQKYGLAPKRARKFRFQPTFDIDQAYSYLHKGLSRNIKGIIRDTFYGKLPLVIERLMVLTGRQPDPFDNYDYLLKLHEKKGIEPIFFILFAAHGAYDKNLSVDQPYFKKLIQKLDCLGRCGIHPSYNTWLDSALLQSEIKALSEVTSGPVIISRQHYLRFKVPDTFRNLAAAGITDDYSLGFASLPGFRAGMSSAFQFYDLEKEEASKLMLHPLSYMEGSMRDYIGNSPDEAILRIRMLIDSVKKVKGTFISLWHNESLGEHGRWKGWRTVYETVLETMTKEE